MGLGDGYQQNTCKNMLLQIHYTQKRKEKCIYKPGGAAQLVKCWPRIHQVLGLICVAHACNPSIQETEAVESEV